MATRGPEAPFFSRIERFGTVGSTNDIVRDWLAAGTPEVCVSVADQQRAGRGRAGRAWLAPSGMALLTSAGFRPTWLAPDRVWRLAATLSLAMADAAEEVAGLADGTVRLKWPNDLVVETDPVTSVLVGPPSLRKLGGVLGESDGLGTDDPWVVVGIGINADWSAAAFPPELAGTMTSLRETAADRPIDRELLLEEFLARLEPRIIALREGWFDVAGWTGRQATTGRTVLLEGAVGPAEEWRAVGVDALTGALVVSDASAPGGERAVLAGEVVQVRLAGTTGRRGQSALPVAQV